ncbi:hypothetical protein Fot_03359 [Forsythia ovata]|uniref:Uncharacterized protein n=1 Tax=Forsythia ovata TaxID=205694 RepID=A0ABD1XDI3_9LAMI
MNPTQYPYHRYNAEENYRNPRFPPEYSQELETSQGSNIFDRLGSRPPRNRRERWIVAAAATAQAPHISRPYQYQTVPDPGTRLVYIPNDGLGQAQQILSPNKSLHPNFDPMRWMMMKRHIIS